MLGFFEEEIEHPEDEDYEGVEDDNENAEVIVLDCDVESMEDTVVLVARAEVGGGGEEA